MASAPKAYSPLTSRSVQSAGVYEDSVGSEEQMLEEGTTSSTDAIWGDCESAWEYVEGEQESGGSPVFFVNLHVHPDGGISEVLTGTKDHATDPLWSWTRIPSAASTIVFAIFNTYYILDVALRQFAKEADATAQEAEIASVNGTAAAQGKPDYMLHGYLIKGILKLMGQDAQFQQQMSAAGLHILEVLMVAGMWAIIFYRLCVICTRPGWRRWYQVYALFTDTLVALSTFSAMRLLFYVTPKIFVARVSSYILGVEHPRYGAAVQEVLFGAVCFFVGFDAFLTKFRSVGEHFIVGKTEMTLDDLYGAVMFLNQMLGVYQLNRMMSKRCYQFVFQGPKERMGDEDLVKADIFNSWLAQTIWTRYPSIVDKIAFLITFSDDDFQHMVLTDKNPHAVDAYSIGKVS